MILVLLRWVLVEVYLCFSAVQGPSVEGKVEG